MPDMRDMLRGLKSLPGPYQPFDPVQAPAEPVALFAEWLRMAIDAGMREPHAMTLSTVDEDGNPDARVLILKNVDEHGWHFAITRTSPKGRQIAHRPRAALTFYWPLLGRQVRIRGRVHDMGPAAQAADFLARPPGSRAGGLVGRQSEVLAAEHELDDALAAQLARLRDAPDLVAPHWAVYAVEPDTVEFWQGSEERRHTRLRYVRVTDGWHVERLWP
ncbi:pyridoxine/pyridoxamine 5'-phosphate oxidase [Burkholderia sp. F1]|uniref:pyridoxine/pyridoxamine 5'-phosphate oxidase n=1 Tax=Burkholderia sp. F1 TaxID=3366817 RepID=UPI003D70322E